MIKFKKLTKLYDKQDEYFDLYLNSGTIQMEDCFLEKYKKTVEDIEDIESQINYDNSYEFILYLAVIKDLILEYNKLAKHFLSEEDLDKYEEKAGILEFCAGMEKYEAEKFSFELIIKELVPDIPSQ